MGYERYPRGTNPNDQYGRPEGADYSRDYGSGRDYSYSSARDYAAAGELGGRYQDRDDSYAPYGQRDQGYSGYQRARGGYGGDYGRGDFGRRDYARGDYDRSRYAQGDEYHGSYAGDGRRFLDVGSRRDWDDDNRRAAYGRYDYDRSRYGRAPQGYDYDDRGFFARAGDEVRSWFGDEDAERRREADARYDERYYNHQADRDGDYYGWRQTQIAALDRDYDEYRRENRSKFENEFSTWRTGRQGQRDLLASVTEHMDVVGSDGSHVGTVDKVRGDRILLTKTDTDAGGRHHSIPSSWLDKVDTKVTLRKSADEAKKHWRDEENNQAMFGDRNDGRSADGRDAQGRMLNRSFTGTY